AQVDVPDHTAIVGAVDHQFDELLILQDGDAGLSWTRIDENLSLHALARPVRRMATRHTEVGGVSRWSDRVPAPWALRLGARPAPPTCVPLGGSPSTPVRPRRLTV